MLTQRLRPTPYYAVVGSGAIRGDGSSSTDRVCYSLREHCWSQIDTPVLLENHNSDIIVQCLTDRVHPLREKCEVNEVQDHLTIRRIVHIASSCGLMALNASRRATGLVAIGTGIDDSVRGAVTGAAVASLPGQVPNCADRGQYVVQSDLREASECMTHSVPPSFASLASCAPHHSLPPRMVQRASLPSSSRAARSARLNSSKTG
eukprot:2275068-Pleurochrysis_carterae.AAC.2